MGKYFGTDGFRGEVGVGLTADHAFLIGKALGTLLFRRMKGEETGGGATLKDHGVMRPSVVIGKDTRRSCYMLEYAVAAGLGDEIARTMHCHFSKIMYTSAGEKKHLTFADDEFGPAFEPLAEAIIREGLSPRIICESDGTMAEDALYMKRLVRR